MHEVLARSKGTAVIVHAKDRVVEILLRPHAREDVDRVPFARERLGQIRDMDAYATNLNMLTDAAGGRGE